MAMTRSSVPMPSPEPYFWNDHDGDTGSIYVDESGDIAVLEIHSRDRKESDGVWLHRADAARLSAWLDAFVNGGPYPR